MPALTCIYFDGIPTTKYLPKCVQNIKIVIVLQNVSATTNINKLFLLYECNIKFRVGVWTSISVSNIIRFVWHVIVTILHTSKKMITDQSSELLNTLHGTQYVLKETT